MKLVILTLLTSFCFGSLATAESIETKVFPTYVKNMETGVVHSVKLSGQEVRLLEESGYEEITASEALTSGSGYSPNLGDYNNGIPEKGVVKMGLIELPDLLEMRNNRERGEKYKKRYKEPRKNW